MDSSKKASVKSRVYAELKQKILSCEYEPGYMLNEGRVSQELGVSRTPVHEALSDLEHDLLVTLYPKQGTVVNPIDLASVNEVFQARFLAEPFILAKYGALIDKERILLARKIQREIKNNQSSPDLQYKADSDLHQIILDANLNRYLTEMLQKVYGQNQRIRIQTGNQSKDRLLKSCNEHLDIIDNLLRSDFAAAAASMERHLLSSWATAVDLILTKA